MLDKMFFYKKNCMTIHLENLIDHYQSLEQFEKSFPEEFLDNDDHVGIYLDQLLVKYDKRASAISEKAGLNTSYVGNIVNGKKRNPSRDALISICFAIDTTLEEVQYLLKYAGQAPLYVRRRRDVIIWFGFMKHMPLEDVDYYLRDHGLKPLLRD